MRQPGSAVRLGGIALLWAIYAACCLYPYVRWAPGATLFDDDLIRVGSLRRFTLAESAFRPFNEHMAPLFEVVSWVAWRAAGRDLLAIAGTFRAASFLALGACAGLLGLVIRRETRLTGSVLLALALLSLSSVSAETVFWYSASSFEWALAMTLLGWYGAAMAGSSAGRSRRGWLAVAAVASAAAPAFSAIGILAGPLASLRAASGTVVEGPIRERMIRAALPWVGTAAYLAICGHFRYGEVIEGSLGRNLDPVAALWAAARAPGLVLIPGLVGLRPQVGRIPGWLAAGLAMLGLIAALASYGRGARRPLILGGLALIAGGYLAAYATRARAGDPWIFSIGRYHLFPRIGLIWLLVGVVEGRIRALDRRPMAGLAVISALATALLWANSAGIAGAVRPLQDTDQPRAIEAGRRLEETWRREGFTLVQAMQALDPVRPRWFPRPAPFHPLLYLFPSGPAEARRGDPEVRPALIAGLSAGDREAIFGGMDATRHAVVPPPNTLSGGSSAALMSISGMDLDALGEYVPSGAESFLEYEVGPGASDLGFLSLGVTRPAEVWWADGSDGWSRGRSAFWMGDPTQSSSRLVVPLAALPHWRAGQVSRVRVVVRGRGRIGVRPPLFLP